MISNVEFIMELISEWLLTYADENNQNVKIDSDGFSRINGEFDLRELAELIDEEL